LYNKGLSPRTKQEREKKTPQQQPPTPPPSKSTTQRAETAAATTTTTVAALTGSCDVRMELDDQFTQNFGLRTQWSSMKVSLLTAYT
jgi:5-enolpyruvylshikimate-3-phosphate synthase